MKHIDVEYLESGTFIGGEEDTYYAGIKHGAPCVVVTKEDFDAMVANESELAGWQAIAREFARDRNKAQSAAADLRELIVELLPFCPDCHSKVRVTLSPPESAWRGKYFCPCNEPSTKPSGGGHFDVRASESVTTREVGGGGGFKTACGRREA